MLMYHTLEALRVVIEDCVVLGCEVESNNNNEKKLFILKKLTDFYAQVEIMSTP